MPLFTTHSPGSLMALEPGLGSDCRPGTRMAAIKDEIERQLDMQFGMPIRDWHTRIDQAFASSTQLSAFGKTLARVFPFTRPSDFLGCESFAAVAQKIFQLAAQRTA